MPAQIKIVKYSVLGSGYKGGNGENTLISTQYGESAYVSSPKVWLVCSLRIHNMNYPRNERRQDALTFDSIHFINE